ncbi:hypothetical protein BDBG_03445 [Blastomyces gilchristii SLH14081]|uniref:Uncharacterized protein n=1 Tax=Blastomyces gilchristii (strain SLH14081) TaxID=559298 RepID=A0A179UH53_BLAGS|nr:uncharacterized protein BDBG_03445 [Blastomyces gilchristii SLH14081]OAT07375.1 hypothetical protein BDBG_03445 [Blastomyces gilchristii SLH14081]
MSSQGDDSLRSFWLTIAPEDAAEVLDYPKPCASGAPLISSNNCWRRSSEVAELVDFRRLFLFWTRALLSALLSALLTLRFLSQPALPSSKKETRSKYRSFAMQDSSAAVSKNGWLPQKSLLFVYQGQAPLRFARPTMQAVCYQGLDST